MYLTKLVEILIVLRRVDENISGEIHLLLARLDSSSLAGRASASSSSSRSTAIGIGEWDGEA